ncbi:MAG: FAD-dependent oxidoreductase [bacterium]|nr:FAD-dependent oxidoreductase [bacterium]
MKKILILGGGFGGVRCALDCARKFKDKATVTLIDQNSYHTFTSALYEIASAYQPTEDPFALELRRAVAIPYKDILENKKVDFIQAQITSIDLVNSKVFLDGGTQLDFDYAVLALGGQTADFGILGVREYAYQFKTTDDAVALHNKLEISFRAMAQGKLSSPVKFLIIGAGFTGIELAGELMTCAKRLARRYGLNQRSFSTILFEAGSVILPIIKETERKKIINRLTDLGVVIMTNSAVESVLSDSVKLKTGQTITGTAVVWTAGVQANRLLTTIQGLPITDKAKIIVDKNLQVTLPHWQAGLPAACLSGRQGRQENSDKLFALGDCVEFIDSKTQKPIPGLAYTAQAQGRLVAENLYSIVFQKRLHPYIPSYGHWVAPVGGKFAVAHLDGFGSYFGFYGWVIRTLVDLRYFLSILPLSKAIKLFGKDLLLFSKND